MLAVVGNKWLSGYKSDQRRAQKGQRKRASPALQPTHGDEGCTPSWTGNRKNASEELNESHAPHNRGQATFNASQTSLNFLLRHGKRPCYRNHSTRFRSLSLLMGRQAHSRQKLTGRPVLTGYGAGYYR